VKIKAKSKGLPALKSSEKQKAKRYDGFLGLHSVFLQPHMGYQFLNP